MVKGDPDLPGIALATCLGTFIGHIPKDSACIPLSYFSTNMTKYVSL